MQVDKQQLREELGQRWKRLWPVTSGPPRPPVFEGVGRAAERLRRLDVYRRAQVVAVMADAVLMQVRINVLSDGKQLLGITPGLKQGMVLVDPGRVAVHRRRRALAGAMLHKTGRLVRLPDQRPPKIDLMVVGALAVDSRGICLGDGRGIADLAWAILGSLGAMEESTPVAVVVADEQVVELLPSEAWDLPVTHILTPTRVLTPPSPARPIPSLSALPPRLARLPVVQATRMAVTS